MYTSSEVTRKRLFYTLSQGPEDGPELVLVHGAGGSRLHWPAELRRCPDATVYTLDLPGHGRSEGPGYETIGAYAKAVVGFLRAVNVKRAIIVGHSMGGAIAQTLALDFPGYVTGLVLVGSGARLRVTPTILEGIRDDFEETAELITRLAWARDTDPALTNLGRQGLLETDPEVLLGDFVACNCFDVIERLDEIKVPALVMGGTADQLTPSRYAYFLARHIPDGRCVTVEGAGHMVMLERPREVVRKVRDFLKEAF